MMRPTQFHIEKEMLKLRIVDQEQVIEREIKKAIDPQRIALKLIPDSIKKMLGLGNTSKPNPAFSIANIFVEAQKIVGNVSQIVAMVKQFRSQMNRKN